uniref:Uncharacterized protein n=1 Tax=Panagrolaimus sp. JU765 TaxID=591449 RepID=A0AC34Q1M6_9BILA
MDLHFIAVFCCLLLQIRSEKVLISGTIGSLSVLEKGDNLEVSFLINEAKEFKYAVYDGFVAFPPTSDDCHKLVEKTRLVLPKKSLEKSVFPKTDLLGHSFVFFKNDEIHGCVTLILKSTKLKSINFSNKQYFGSLFAISFPDFIRILPQLSRHSFKEKSVVDFNLLPKCPDNFEEELPMDSGMIDIRNISAVDVMLNASSPEDVFLQIVNQNQPVICKKFDLLRPLIAWTPVLQLEQRDPFTAVEIKDNFKKIKILNCTDKNKIDVTKNLQLFGKNTAIFKKIQINGECLTLYPWKSAPAMMTKFLNPIFGEIFIVNVGGQYFLASDLVSIFDKDETKFLVKLSKNFVQSIGCLDFEEDYSANRTFILDAHKQQRPNDFRFYSLDSFLPFDELKSIEIDIGWTKICANLTFVASDGLKARGSLRSHNIASSRQVASLEFYENPLIAWTEVLFDHFEEIDDFVFHSRPIDSSITAGPPCSEVNIGPKTNSNWTSLIHESFIEKNKTRLLVHGKLLTDSRSILGQSILAQTKNAVACGTFVLENEERVAIAFFNDSVSGYIKMFDNPRNPTVPIRILYFLENGSKTEPETTNDVCATLFSIN